MATFAEDMVTKYEALLAANAGVGRVVVDGVDVSYTELERRYDGWKRRVDIEKGVVARGASIDLSGA